jgi:predicted amidohydrolase YtcJ
MVVIDKDFATCPEDGLKDIEPLQTVVGGKVIYDRDGADK